MCLGMYHLAYFGKGKRMTDIDKFELRMQVWRDHVEDCAGLWEPLSWEDFKHFIWNRWPNDWATCFLQAGKLAHKRHHQQKSEVSE